jgi:hypothetical protein
MSDEDDEAPDDADRSDEPADIACPYCKRQISEEALQCPCCGSYLSIEDAPRLAKPWWWIVAVVLIVLLLLTYLMRG